MPVGAGEGGRWYACEMAFFDDAVLLEFILQLDSQPRPHNSLIFFLTFGPYLL